MKANKKIILETLQKGNRKDAKFESLVLNLALQKINSESFEFDGEAVYTADMKFLVYCVANNESFKIPDGVETIGEMAFRQKKRLKRVVIPATVKTIEKDAFYDCDDLEKVYIPASVQEVRAYAFAECDNLKEVVFAGVPEHLSRHAFDESEDIHSIIVPSGTAKIFRKALHVNDGDADFIVVEDRNNRIYIDREKQKTSKGDK